MIAYKLPVIIFKEDDQFVAYSPAIDLSTCADTFDDVQRRFEEAAIIFFKELIKMGTLDEVLEELGWQKVKKDWVPPHIIAQTQQEIKIPA